MTDGKLIDPAILIYLAGLLVFFVGALTVGAVDRYRRTRSSRRRFGP